MNVYEALDSCSQEFRKQSAVVTHEGTTEHVDVTHLWMMPHESEAVDGLEFVDMHFVRVAVDRDKAEGVRQVVTDWCDAYPRLSAGPSYIEVGAEIGDQGIALKLFAVGQVLGLWTVITPETMGITGADADRMAGNGFVMCTGYHNNGKP